MCVAVPARVLEVRDGQLAVVEMEGAPREVSTALIDGVCVGDYVLVHAGFALSKLGAEEAAQTLALLSEVR